VKLVAAAVAVEGRKALAARVPVATAVLLVAGVSLIAVGMSLAARGGNQQVVAKLGPAASVGGWDGLVGISLQVTAAGGVLACGVMLTWIIGREFADGTVSGLFALPVRRPTIALAKLVVYLLWSAAVGVALAAMLALVGLALGLGWPDVAAGRLLLRVFGLTVLSALIAAPAGWMATLGRGLLPGIAATVGTIVVAQVMVVAGTGAWFPFTAPALWALQPAAVSPPQLALVLVVPLVFATLTIHAWHRFQLDR
jgi:ABC-2 type transport system permease protein